MKHIFNVQRIINAKTNLILYAIVSPLVILFVSLLASEVVAAEVNYYEPTRGSQERKAIMDAARIPISREVGTQVIFIVDVLRTDGQMAYLQGTPINPDSTALDWNNTPFREAWSDDMMSDVVMVLLERQNDRWTVKDHVIGPTDVFWYGWLEKYGVPEALFYGD